MDTLGWLLASAAGLFFLGLVVYQIIYLKLNRPKAWKQYGTAPAHVDVALAVVREMLPEQPKRWGGVVHWVEGPFKLSDGGLAAGLVLDMAIPEVRVTRYELVHQTALAHELIHCFTGWVDGDPRLQPLVAKMNEEIKKRLAAVG